MTRVPYAYRDVLINLGNTLFANLQGAPPLAYRDANRQVLVSLRHKVCLVTLRIDTRRPRREAGAMDPKVIFVGSCFAALISAKQVIGLFDQRISCGHGFGSTCARET